MPRRRDYMGGDDQNIDEGQTYDFGGPGAGNLQQQSPQEPSILDRTNPAPRGPGEVDGVDPTGRGSEGPRERATIQNPGQMGAEGPQITSTPRQPSSPTPAMNASFEAGPPANGGAPTGVMPFSPMGGPDALSQASPKLRSLYGAQGGLQGGGLGVPGSASPATNDPLSLLIQQLLMSSGG